MPIQMLFFFDEVDVLFIGQQFGDFEFVFFGWFSCFLPCRLCFSAVFRYIYMYVHMYIYIYTYIYINVYT